MSPRGLIRSIEVSSARLAASWRTGRAFYHPIKMLTTKFSIGDGRHPNELPLLKTAK
ncbi:hypothetical protein OF001_U160084 [Pseudomonas sp. OF001]|nr:hypothetical protein OF001_U160084 [Pseudomonas sp. OF001]